ncbi:MAG: site-2 protease family protein [Planctomycetes bacterium]|nr:site-2 protease family protein [Planctomycetota bacterium]
MSWSLKIGKIFGIDFRIHVTFLLLLFLVFASGLSEKGLPEALRAVLFICAVFACVLIHELGHSLIARRFGTQAKSITLLPIGGIATVEEMPEKPSQEIAMSVIGPLINLAIAGVLFLAVGPWAGFGAPDLYPSSWRAFFAGLISVNVLLAIFNMIPAFPMDGGRVLRGILALRMDYVRATSIAVSVGQALSMLFIFFGILHNWWLAIIGFFLYIGAGSEKQQVLLRSALRRVPAREAMVTDFRVVRPDEPLARALEHAHHGCQEDFPVIGDAGIEGVLTRDRILAAIHEKGVNVPVSEVMDRNFASFDPQTTLDKVYRQLLSENKSAGAVLEDGALKGMLCLETISRYLMYQSALEKSAAWASSSTPSYARQG